MSEDIVKGKYYPEMPPMLQGEMMDQYTDRLTGADQTNRRPYDHYRQRQCSLGWHDECSDPQGLDCCCPCHRDPHDTWKTPQEPAESPKVTLLGVGGSSPVGGPVGDGRDVHIMELDLEPGDNVIEVFKKNFEEVFGYIPEIKMAPETFDALMDITEEDAGGK